MPFQKTAAEIFRDEVNVGVPAIPKHTPKKEDIRSWGTYLEGLASLAFTSSLVYTTKAALLANLAPSANTPAMVIGDAIAGNDGLYQKTGASNVGSWTQLTDYVPGQQLVTATSLLASTPNAIQTSTTIGIASSNQLIICDLSQTNAAGPVTIKFNSGAPMPLKTSSGNQPPAGSLPLRLVGSIFNGEFRLLNDVTSSAIQTAAEAAAADAELSAAQADTSADLAQTERIAAQAAAAAAANFAGVSYGVNLGSPVLHATNFTVSALDYGLLHILTPSLGQTLEVTLPPAASNVGKVIAFSVPHEVSGIVQFKATAGQVSSLISDYATDDFFIWHKETITLLAASDRWLILDWRKNPFFLQADLPAADINLTAGGSDLLNGWVGANHVGTYLRHSVFGLSGGNIVLPRRGGYLFEVDIFCSWTGTPPIYLYTEIDTSPGGIAGRGYADFIQAASPTQANIHWRKSLNGNRNTVVNPRVYCGTGSTTPKILASAAQPRLRLTEMF